MFAAGGNPVEKEKSLPYNISIEEARRILGQTGDDVNVVELDHEDKASA